jgi:hypothetical protein
VPYSNSDSQAFLSALKTKSKNARQQHLAQHLAQLSRIHRDKLCANTLQFFFFSPKWPILQLKPTLLLVMPLLSVHNKDNNNEEVTNKNEQDTGVTDHKVTTPTIQTIPATNKFLAHDGTTLATGNSAFSAR